MRRLVHISDLHIGRDAKTDAAALALCESLVAEDVDAVLVTGDVTHRGRRAELAAFERMFAPLADRMSIVPGNHDRAGEDMAQALMPGARVQAELRDGLFVVRLDSTAPHNRRLIDSHGALTPRDIAAIDEAVASAPPGALVVLMLHHHLLPLPEDHWGERLASLLGLPNAAELRLGRDLIGRILGRCDLVLHGHRHRTGEVVCRSEGLRSLHVLNAGSTPELGRARLIEHAAGSIVAMSWLEVQAAASAPEARRRQGREKAALPAAA